MTWRGDRVALLGMGISLLALALRLAHVLTSAKLHIADDAVFFVQHATAFAGAWRSVGQPEFPALLRDAVDHASLQGIVYPVFLSAVYGVRGWADQRAAVMAQALLGGATVWLTFLTTRRLFGDLAAVAAGVIAALYPPLVLTSGLLLAEAVLLFLQALTAWALTHSRGLSAGLGMGTLMLRPAFQYAGLLTVLGLAPARPGQHVLARYVAGLLVVAVPWLLTNGLVFDRFVWSRTGDAWQQVYWGIYPPNRGWWPPDSPVPPKYGVESLPGARSAGRTIETRDLDYLEAAIDQVRATPLQALATEVNKLVHGYRYPFNTYGEAPPLVAGLAPPLHGGLAWLALLGAALAARRREAWPLAGLALGVALPFLVSHIDVRYVIPVALAALPFAGLAASSVWNRLAAGWRPARMALASLAGLAVAAALDVPILLAGLRGLEPLFAHRLHITLLTLGILAAGYSIGRWMRATTAVTVVASGTAAVVVIQGLYAPGWHEWNAVLRPGERAVQRIELPADWAFPAGARAEVRVYADGPSAQTYEPVLYANGSEVARLGRAFTEGGPLRFEERVMLAASRQGKSRAEVPQWYGLPLESGALAGGGVELAVGVDGPPGSWVRVWGDYATGALEVPAVHSRIQGQDDSFQKFVATGHGRLWRRHPLASASTLAALERNEARAADDLSPAPGRQTGAFRLRVLIFSQSGELLSIL